MSQINEMSFRDHIARDALAVLLSHSLDVEINRIGTVADFWSKGDGPEGLDIGMDVLWADAGFRTFLKWHQKQDLSEVELLQLAAKASKQFGTEVAIGNFIDSPEVSTDRFLVVMPDGHLYRAYATSNTDVFDVAPEGPSLFSVADVIAVQSSDSSKPDDELLG